MNDRSIGRRLALGGAAAAPVLGLMAAAQAQGADKLVVIADLVAKPDKADALRSILVPFVEVARAEPGCEHYTLLEDRSKPGHFVTYEVWSGEAALAAHMQTPAIKAAGVKLADILAAPFTQTMLKTLSAS